MDYPGFQTTYRSGKPSFGVAQFSALTATILPWSGLPAGEGATRGTGSSYLESNPQDCLNVYPGAVVGWDKERLCGGRQWACIRSKQVDGGSGRHQDQSCQRDLPIADLGSQSVTSGISGVPCFDPPQVDRRHQRSGSTPPLPRRQKVRTEQEVATPYKRPVPPHPGRHTSQ